MTLYVDMDGVLADFSRRANEICGVNFAAYCNTYGMAKGWAKLDAVDFYRDCPPMPDFKELWDGIAHMNPIILTALPLKQTICYEKWEWVKRYIGVVPMIPVFPGADKSLFCQVNDVLIDDSIRYERAWLKQKGYFILHKNAKASLGELKNTVYGRYYWLKPNQPKDAA